MKKKRKVLGEKDLTSGKRFWRVPFSLVSNICRRDRGEKKKIPSSLQISSLIVQPNPNQSVLFRFNNVVLNPSNLCSIDIQPITYWTVALFFGVVKFVDNTKNRFYFFGFLCLLFNFAIWVCIWRRKLGMASKSNDDLYGVLGLKKECTTTELRTAYKKLALRWHPDRCSSMGNSEFVEESKKKFQAIQEAYSVLSDSNKRFLYDVGAYNSDDDDQNGMGDFLNEMAVMMNQSKPSENNGGDSFEQLQDLFNEIFQGDSAAFSSSSCSNSSFTSSCSFTTSNDQRSHSSLFETSSIGINDPFGFADPRIHHTFSLGVDHQQDFKKGKSNGGGRRNRRRNNPQSAAHETSSSNNYGVPTS